MGAILVESWHEGSISTTLSCSGDVFGICIRKHTRAKQVLYEYRNERWGGVAGGIRNY